MTGPSDEGTERVVLLDEDARPRGTGDKLAVHEAPGVPHLAFSVMVVDGDGRYLLQRRAAGKYHFASFWSNTCCSHPRAGEPVREAARRRLVEELGLDIAEQPEVCGAFWYRADDAQSGLVEVEYDVVLRVRLSPASRVTVVAGEVDEVAWVTPDEARALVDDPTAPTTPWLRHVLDVLAAPDPTAVASSIPL